MSGIYLLLGSNLGDSNAMLEKARAMISMEIGGIITTSSLYATKAWGAENQPDFLNQVVEVDSALSPEELLKKVNEIEKALGRVRKTKWGTRSIDIDILYYQNEIVQTENLLVPHPQNQNRNFVLVPMVEIAPDFVHPIFKCSQKELLEKSPDKLGVTKLSSEA